MHPTPSRVNAEEGGRQGAGQDSRLVGRTNMPGENKELCSGGKTRFPAPGEQAHRELEGFSRKQPDWGSQNYSERGSGSPSREQHDWVLCFSPTELDGQHRTHHWESARWSQVP